MTGPLDPDPGKLAGNHQPRAANGDTRLVSPDLASNAEPFPDFPSLAP